MKNKVIIAVMMLSSVLYGMNDRLSSMQQPLIMKNKGREPGRALTANGTTPLQMEAGQPAPNHAARRLLLLERAFATLTVSSAVGIFALNAYAIWMSNQ